MVFIVGGSLISSFRRVCERNDILEQHTIDKSTSMFDAACAAAASSLSPGKSGPESPSADLPFPSFCLQASDFLDEKLTFSRRPAAANSTTTTHSFTLYQHHTVVMGRIKKKGMHTIIPRDYTRSNNHSQAPLAMPKTTSPAPRPSANSNSPSQTSDDYVSSRVSTRVSRATGSV